MIEKIVRYDYTEKHCMKHLRGHHSWEIYYGSKRMRFREDRLPKTAQEWLKNVKHIDIGKRLDIGIITTTYFN